MIAAAASPRIRRGAARGPARIRASFESARVAGRAALITYVMAGFPDEATALAAAEAVIAAGADLVEVGVPFSDPVADGPVVAAAGRAVLSAGGDGGMRSALRLIESLRDRGHRLPLLAMSYLDPIVAPGAASVLAAIAGAGADGLIVPDLPAGEDPHLERMARTLGLGMCFLVAPNTGPGRLELAIRSSTGFLYLVPIYGVTGARDALAERTVPLLERVRSSAEGRVPVAAGFGISKAEHVRALSTFADGVVVGSALIAELAQSGTAGPGRLGGFVRELAASLKRVGP